jgi:hypothetical protein
MADSSRETASRFTWPSTNIGSILRRSFVRSATRYSLSSRTGRRRSTIDAVGPRTVVIHAASSSTLLTVADRQTSRTCCGRWIITSSHTGPR